MPYRHAVNLDWEAFPLDGVEPPKEGAQDKIRALSAAIRSLPPDATVASVVDVACDLAQALDEDGADAALLSFEMDIEARDLALPVLDRVFEAHGIMPLYPVMTENGPSFEESERAQPMLAILSQPDPRIRTQMWMARWLEAQTNVLAALQQKDAARSTSESHADLVRANGLPDAAAEAGCMAADILSDFPVARILKVDHNDTYLALQRASRPYAFNDRPWSGKIGKLDFGR